MLKIHSCTFKGNINRVQHDISPSGGDDMTLQDFHGQGCHLGNANDLFNLRHASLRNTIERLFEILKSGYFTIFKTALQFPYNTKAELVLACVGLQNFI